MNVIIPPNMDTPMDTITAALMNVIIRPHMDTPMDTITDSINECHYSPPHGHLWTQSLTALMNVIIRPNMDTPMDTITDLLKVECVCSSLQHFSFLSW